jgi:hypothetical protein
MQLQLQVRRKIASAKGIMKKAGAVLMGYRKRALNQGVFPRTR